MVAHARVDIVQRGDVTGEWMAKGKAVSVRRGPEPEGVDGLSRVGAQLQVNCRVDAVIGCGGGHELSIPVLSNVSKSEANDKLRECNNSEWADEVLRFEVVCDARADE